MTLTLPLSSANLAPGISPSGQVHRNCPPAELCELALSRGEGRLTRDGAFVAVTHPHGGRSPNDRFIVRDACSQDSVSWGAHNRAIGLEEATALRDDLVAHLGRRTLFVHEARAGDHPRQGVNVRVVTESAWHAMFAQNMFLRLPADSIAGFKPDFTVLHAPSLQADPARHGTASETAIVLDLANREVLIAGTRYAGEIKKSIFAALNFLLPEAGILPMHCSANVGGADEVALFFGLSGTGKTTLSTDVGRRLIGDDEHGWGPDGIFNFEGGCYAKTIDLSPDTEPAIHAATRRFGTILENVLLDEARSVRFHDRSLTENTRASYPIDYIPGAVEPSRAGHPSHVIFLAADAFGVLPPIAKLTPEQAMYHFLSGYTAKVAGTERGVTEPTVTFSACFGAPFMPRPASVYAKMLGELLRRHDATVWLVNTGWTGGSYGTGTRMNLPHTRAMVNAALAGQLDGAAYHNDPIFGVAIPDGVEGVPRELLCPRDTWGSKSDFDESAARLAGMFHENFEQFRGMVTPDVANAGPRR